MMKVVVPDGPLDPRLHLLWVGNLSQNPTKATAYRDPLPLERHEHSYTDKPTMVWLISYLLSISKLPVLPLLAS